MEDQKIDEDRASSSTKDYKPKSILCSKCKKVISKGESYIKLILTGEILCSECDEGLFEGDDLLAFE